MKQLTVKPETVIVCDNGSTDGSLLKISDWAKKNYSAPQEMDLVSTKRGLNEQEHPPEFVLIKNGANLGYAAGNNNGIRVALSTYRFEFIWLLNNDTQPSKDALKHLKLCAIKHPNTGIFGSTIVNTERPNIVQCAGGYRYYPLTTICRAVLKDQTLGFVLEQPEPKLDYIYGASFFVRSEVFKKCSLLNEDYFLYFEEVDFCLRAKQQGYKISWCKDSIVAHKGGATIKNNKSTLTASSNGHYNENLSALLFTKNWYPGLLPVAFLFRLIGKLAALVQRKEWQSIPMILKAHRDFICHKKNQRTMRTW
ncbi:MAG: glycosyltransferase family 2 protein [Gammaproteobacteria bacterium]|nr:MAG: glycosyltransferase family 2 protein [Gammaproteobacteria bacterium]